MTIETKTREPSIDTSAIVANLRAAKKELMIAMVRPMLDKEQTRELATRLGEVSYTIKKLEAMK